VVGLFAVAAMATAAGSSASRPVAEFAIAPGALRTGILYDRVVPISGLEQYRGDITALPATSAVCRQILFELTGAAVKPVAWPAWDDLRAAARRHAAHEIPVMVLDFEYERLRQPATAPQVVTAADVVVERVFAASGLRETTYRGSACSFGFETAWSAGNRAGGLHDLAVDLDDGRGWRAVRWGDRPLAHYDRRGRKHIRVRATDATGVTLHASFAIEVAALGTPAPDDTLHVVASTPYLGVAGSGSAYVYLAPGHTAVQNPIVVIEGFDLDDSMGWDELYAVLSQEGLIETLRAQGFDAVVLDFTQATDYIQRNAFVVTELLAQLEAAIPSAADMVVVGASMGGLVGRYALAVLESQAMPARVRTFISFDAPHRGANIPLGVQYWVQFFADLSAEAALQRDLLDTPAARQMLAVHFTVPPTPTAAADPLRAQLVADLAAAGDYPTQPRLVAIANGSGTGNGQGFGAAAQIIRYEYDSFLVDIRGNVWAVPDAGNTTIFRGLIDYLIGTDASSTVTVAPGAPYDNAPGGRRGTMADMDATMAPFGDIVALHPAHCFIPTVSALDFDTANLFHDIAADPNALAQTPFDAMYYPAVNQEHVFIDAATAGWLLAEIPPLPTSAPPPVTASPAALALHPNVPNPFNPSTRLEFDVPRAGVIDIAILDVRGRRVATLARGRRDAGRHAVGWDGTTTAGTRATSGVYVCVLTSAGERVARRIVLLQ